ncbi:unnamed protein product [Microthlaspi erraticum]|uniref:Reverse transcriptase zinc-binding domain-containing protein n=1 Tax=Microthlaspi erraticum TaxID=1685480 RepID=A0A6D2I6A7_9BRAS|nr:unnamed protein product [Microthlaspi erraticum]
MVKMVMLKSVLADMPSFTMSYFKLLLGLRKKIQSALIRFWWDGRISIGKELLRQKLGKVFGDGKSTSIWFDLWLSLSEKLTPVGPSSENSSNLKVSELISPTNLDWDTSKIRHILPELEQDILCLKPSISRAPDKFVWLPSISGMYTTKTGYYTAKELSWP